MRARLTGLSIPQGVSQVEAASGDKVTRYTHIQSSEITDNILADPGLSVRQTSSLQLSGGRRDHRHRLLC